MTLLLWRQKQARNSLSFMYPIEIGQVKPDILSGSLVGLLYYCLTRNLCLSGMEVAE